jgi:hypothetical protein
MKPILIFVVFLVLCIGCGSYKEFDPAHPHDYDEYWKNEDNRKNSILYPSTSECNDKVQGQEIDSHCR